MKAQQISRVALLGRTRGGCPNHGCTEILFFRAWSVTGKDLGRVEAHYVPGENMILDGPDYVFKDSVWESNGTVIAQAAHDVWEHPEPQQ